MSPPDDAVRLAQIVEDYFHTLPIFGDRVITLREGCALHEEARRMLREARREQEN